MHRWIKAILCAALATGVIMMYLDFHQPASMAATAYYQQHYARDTGAGNIVAAIYLNYRIFDSMLETLMLLVSATAVVALSWRGGHD